MAIKNFLKSVFGRAVLLLIVMSVILVAPLVVRAIREPITIMPLGEELMPQMTGAATGSNQLTSADITEGDSGNILSDGTGTTTYSFLNGSFEETYFNDALDAIVLANTVSGFYVSQVFDAGEEVSWNRISWSSNLNIDITDNILLMYMNGFGAIPSGATILDSSGWGNNGIVYGNEMSYLAGKIDQAVDDTLNTYIDIDASQSGTDDFDFGIGDFTWAYWVKTSQSGSGNKVHISRDGGSHMWMGRLGPENGGGVVRPSGTGNYQVFEGSRVNDGEWHHLVLVKSGNNPPNIAFYMDGSLVPGQDFDRPDWVGLPFDFSSDDTLTIGDYEGGKLGQYAAEGLYDEIAIWKRAFSPEEVESLYDRGVARLTLSVRGCDDPDCIGESFVSVDDHQNMSLTGRYFQYRLDFETDDAALSPQLFNVTIEYEAIQPALPQFTNLTLRQSINQMEWDPVSGSLTSGFSMNLDPAQEYYYLDVDQATANMPLATGYHEFFISSHPYGFFEYWEGRGLVAGATGWQGVMWEIINGYEPMFYLNVTDGPGYMLVDGLQKLIGQGDTFLRLNGNYPLGDYSFSGTISDPSGNTSDIIIDMTFFSTAFCLDGTDAYYPMDESAAPYANIFGGNDADCTNTKCPTAVIGLVGDAQQFDGTDDEVLIPDDGPDAFFNWAQTDSFSIEYWMWTDQSTSGNRVIVGRDGGPTNLHWWIGCTDSGKVGFQLRDTTGNGLYLGNKGPQLNLGAWHHIVAVREYIDNDPSINSWNRIYVDGVLIDEGTYNYSDGFEESVGVNVGYILLNHNYRYAGIVDELAFYNKALTELEIQQHFINGQASYGCCEAVAPQIISQEVAEATVGQPYTYDVDAIGNPASTYALTQAPDGMTIDPLIGLVEWTPTAAGDFDVCVEVNSDDVTDTQCFTITVSDAGDCPSGMVSYWKLDEIGSPSTFDDAFGGNSAICIGACPLPGEGIVNGGQGFSRTGNTGLNVDVADGLNWGVDDSFSVEFWMAEPGDISGNAVIIGRQGLTHPNPHIWIGVTSGGVANFSLWANNNDSAVVQGATSLTAGGWHHIVAVRERTTESDQIRIYVDGIEEGAVSHFFSNGFETTTPINIGWLNLSGGYHYDGQLDEVAIYERALSAAEIQHHYANGLAGHGGCETVAPEIVSAEATEATVGQPYTYDVNATGNPMPIYALTEAPDGMTIDPDTGLIEWLPTSAGYFNVCVEVSIGELIDTQCFTISVDGPTGCPIGMQHYWKLDDTVGSTFTDAFGGSLGTCTDCPIRVGGILGSARSFNGSTNEINVPDDGSFDWGANDEFSIELWMTRPLPQPIPENDVIIGRDDRSTGLHWWLGLNTSGQPMFVLLDNDGSDGNNGGNGSWPTSSEDITDDDLWHHIVAVKETTHIRIYVDGAEKSAVPKTYNDGFGSSVDLNIGWLSLDKKYTFDGAVDEIALYNRALTLDEIQVHYNDGAGRGYCSASVPPTDVNLAAYWKLDEAEPSFYEDMVGSSDGGCRATGNCPIPTVAGKLGGGQEFSRSLQTGINAPGEDFNWLNGDSFTVAFWMKKDNVCSGTTTNDNEVIAGRDDVSSQLHWWVGVGCRSDYPQQGGAVFNLIDKNAGEENTAIYGETDLTDGEWHLVVAQRDGLLQENRLYVDGRLESKISIEYSDGFDSATEPINIGWLNLSDGFYYAGILDEVAIYNSAISEPEIRFLYYIGRDYRDRCSSPINVMELGDSITYDNYSGDPRPSSLRTGYRSHLWWMLADAGYYVDSVGSIIAGEGIEPYFDPDNAGYPGATDDQIASLLDTGISPKPDYPGTPTPPGGPYLDYYQPDVILLHIGTNGLCSSGPACADAVANILDEVDEYELRQGKDAVVLLSRIIARQGDTCSLDTGTIFNASTGSSTSAYNNYVEDMVLNRIANGDRIILLDMECGANINYSTEMIDTLHPTDAGYAKMAGVWMYGNDHQDAMGLTEILPVCGPPEPAQPFITSEPLIQAYSGWFYTYDVDAVGYPAPEYRLAQSPPGMTIDSATGIITWFAGDIGNYDVIVDAYNSEAAVPQEFTILVEEAPPCPENMTHYLKLDEVSGGVYTDLFSSNSGTCAGSCPEPDTGIVSGAQVFSRGAGTGLNLPADASFDWGSSDSFSIEFWMKKDPGTETCSGSDTSANEVIAGRDDASSQLHWWIGIGCNTDYPTQGGAVFNLIDTNAGESGTADISGQVGTAVYGSKNLIDGEWHHVVVVRDGTTNMLIVDGILEDSMTLAYSNGFGSAVAPINIGWLNLSGGYRFSGTLDEVAVYSRALELNEIQLHFINGLCSKGYCEPVEMIDVPDVVGNVQADAEAVIIAANLRVGTIIYFPSDIIPAGEVISQDPPAGVQLPNCSAVALEVSLGDFAYFQNFETYAAGSDPADWVDTGANNSLAIDNSLFKVFDLNGEMVFGTTSTLTNIHSHYDPAICDATVGFVFTGRMRMSDSDGGIGVTFLSDYPNSDIYYRLRHYSGNDFHISPHGTTVAGDADSGVIPTANIWYLYRIEVIDTGSRTEIKANVWAEGSGEPSGWQIDAYDDSLTRLTAGTIGIWSMGEGSKYWDDLAVELLEPVNRPPVANCALTPSVGAAPLTVNFDGSGSSDPDGTIEAYAWDFGDGNTATGSSGQYTYVAAGVYTVHLTVTDNEGATGATDTTVTVSEPDQPPSIVTHPADLSVTEGEAATFTVVATGTAPLSYQWQRWNDPTSTWEDIEGAVDSSYTIAATIFPDHDGERLRCIVFNNVDPAGVSSNDATLSVVEPSYAYFEDFGDVAGLDPAGWLDTGAKNSMDEDDSLFATYDVGGGIAFGTSSTLSNIHSHYTITAYDAADGFVLTGRMRMSSFKSGIGVTFLSDYPFSDRYYRLRRYNGNAFHLAPHGTKVAGDTDSGVVPATNTWYLFKILVQDTGSRIEIKANVWEQDTEEPADWQIDAYDDSADRLTTGKIGVWSYSLGSKYWDDIKVELLGP